MKNLGFIFLIVSCCGQILALENSSVDTDHQNEKDEIPDRNIDNLSLNNNFDGDYNKTFGRNDFVFDAGNPDIHGEIIRPCQAYDTFCIRKFFAQHSKCKISGRRLPDPFRRAQSTFNFPSANISVTSTELSYGGLSAGRVEEFYINKKTDNLVIAFYFDSISLFSNNNNLKFYLRRREPEVHRDVASQVYEQITITLVIPGLDDLRLDRAEIHTYVNNPVLPFAVGPNLALSSDPEVIAMFAFFASANIRVELLEQLSTEGVFFGTNYLQYNICDFGLKVL